jgi:hypothetical protein
MKDKTKYVPITVSLDLHTRLLTRKHPGQSIGGVIEEMLNELEYLTNNKTKEAPKTDSPTQTTS